MFIVIVALVTLAVLTASVTMLSGACAGWYAASPSTRPNIPRREADKLLLVRVLPTALTAVLLAAVVPVMLLFEPREGDESFGYLFWMLAAAGAGLVARSFSRTMHAIVATGQTTRTWLSDAHRIDIPGAEVPTYRIDTERPIVALVGLRRSRLFISRRVLIECSADRLAAIVAHEMAHARSRDNLKRLVLLISIDPLGLTRWGRALSTRWEALVEEAADHTAILRGTPPLDLASALVGVARMGNGTVGSLVSTFQRAETFEHRLHRLLEGYPPASIPRRVRPPAIVGVVIVATSLASLAWNEQPLRSLFVVVESFVQALP
jgi:Zn-dependent protease with chaperone function